MTDTTSPDTATHDSSATEEPLLIADALTAGYIPGVNILNDCSLCGENVVFEVTLDVGGQTVVVISAVQSVSCVY